MSCQFSLPAFHTSYNAQGTSVSSIKAQTPAQPVGSCARSLDSTVSVPTTA
jgi:hypothetical protein